jgi:hypothetical protein
MSNPSGPPPTDLPSPPDTPRQPATWRRNPRLSAAIAFVVIVAVAAGTVVIVRRGSGSASPPAATGRSKSPALPSSSTQGQATVAEQIMIHHADRDGQLDVAGALQLFANAFTPLPGVTLPNGGRADAASYADLAIRSMLVHWPELTVDQRRALATVLNTSGASTVALRGGPASAQLTAALVNSPPGLQVKVQQALLDEAKRLKHSLSDVGVTDTNKQVIAVAANVELYQGGMHAGAWTWVTSGAATIDPNSSTAPGTTAKGTPTNCYIYFPPSFWQNLVWTPGSDEYDTLYHEVFHCYQGFVLGQSDLSAYDTAPGWLIEGSAEWAGDSMSGSNDFTWPDSQAPPGYGYLNNPSAGLAQQSHEAFGLFYEIEYLGEQLWPEWWSFWTEGSVGGWTTDTWFNTVAGNVLTPLSEAWGASYYVNATLGKDWTETAANQSLTYQKVAKKFGGALGVALKPYSTEQVDIAQPAKGMLVVINTSQGTPRYVDDGGDEVINEQVSYLCWDTCQLNCPPGTAPVPPPARLVHGTVHWELTAFGNGGAATLATEKPDQACKQAKPTNTCNWSCADSNGDPHLTTVTHNKYDFQATGEFVLLRSTDGSIEIQGRQEPSVAGSRSGPTRNTAMAARVGTHRVGVYLTANQATTLETRVDGAVTGAATTDLGGGARLVIHSNGDEIDFADGTVLWAVDLHEYGINILVRPSLALFPHSAGLLARVPPGKLFPPLPDGSDIAWVATTYAQAYDFKYQHLATAWRVTNHDTLFDYQAGRTTASYTVAGFVPETGATQQAFDPGMLARSDTTCAPVTDVELHDECVYDVTVTGDNGYVAGYESTQAAAQQGAPALDQGGGSGVTAQAGVTDLLANVSHIDWATLAPDGKVYASVFQGTDTATGTTQLLVIDPTTAAIVAHTTLTTQGQVLSGLLHTAGSLWYVYAKNTPTVPACSIVRADPTTLQQLASIPLSSCPSATPSIVAAGNDIWTDVLDSSATHVQLLRFDTSSNQQVSSITLAVPAAAAGFAGSLHVLGFLDASDSAVFWTDTTTTYRVEAPWTDAVNLQAPGGHGFAVGDGIWIDHIGEADLFGGSGGQQSAVQLPGRLVSADANALYVEERGTSDNTRQLWQVPIDGSPAVMIATAPPDSNPPWELVTVLPVWITDHSVLTLDLRPPANASPGSQQLDLVLVATARQ